MKKNNGEEHEMYEHIVNSNQIEGVFDLAEVPKSLTAWEYLNAEDQLTKENLYFAHRLVMVDLLYPSAVGVYRNYNVKVGSYIAPSFFVVPELMREYIAELNLSIKNPDVGTPKEFHIKFERIHPFGDGNGRIGRLIMWWHEAQIGRNPTLISYDNRYEYYDWFI